MLRIHKVHAPVMSLTKKMGHVESYESRNTVTAVDDELIGP